MYTNEYQNLYQPPIEEQPQQDPKPEKPRKERKFGKKMTKCVAYALAFGLVSGTAFQGSSYVLNNIVSDSSAESTASDSTKLAATAVSTGSSSAVTSTDVSNVVSEVMPSIVAITNMSEVQYQSFFGQTENYESESAGSGIIVKEDDDYLYIVTNNHVVTGANSLTVQFSDESTVSAEVQGTDESNDLAVVKVKKSDITADTLSTIKVATIGDSDSLAVGEAAIAIGNALGYGQSVTTGVISALNREVTISDETTGTSYTNSLIQTDAAINPGNSGGALINTQGEVIGINSSKYSDTSVEGMGFSIPMATAEPIIEDLITNGTVTASTQGGYLGIAGVDVTDEVSSAYNIPAGVYVTQVMEDSVAQSAGLSQGDIITKIDDQEVSSISGLKQIISGHEAGDKVTITYQRRDTSGSYQEATMEVTLGEYPADDSTTSSDTEQSGSSNQQGSDNSQGSGNSQGGSNSQDNSQNNSGQSGQSLLPELPGSGSQGGQSGGTME